MTYIQNSKLEAKKQTEQKKILICDRFSIEALVSLKKNSNFNIIHIQSEEHFLKEFKTAHALIIRSKQKITEAIVNAAEHLQVIVTCTSGYDHIDLQATQKKLITVMYTPGANQVAAAELTWGLVLACAKKIPQSHHSVKSGHWNRDLFTGLELAGKTYGVIGLGRIGSRVAKMAKAFDMTVLAFDPYQDDDVFLNAMAERVSYEELLKQSDIISFHVPATKETKNMFNRTHYEFVQPNAILVNTSRGSVVHEEDLADALLEKKICAAGLDVFEKEPLPHNSKLLKCSNVILTTHLGGYTEEAFQKASEQGAQQIIQFFNLEKTENTLPLVNLWGTLSFQEGT